MGDSERAAPVPTTVAGADESFFQRQREEHLLNAMNARAHGRGADSNLNYEEEIRELPGWNPNMPKEMAPPSYLTAEVRDRDAGGYEGGIPGGVGNLAEAMPELYISDPGLRQATSRSRIGLLPAGISSNARHYKMASDIFGTGMDRTWSANEAPQRPIHSFVPKQPQSGKERNAMDSVKQLEESMMGPPQPRNRNEPGSFKITETASDNSAEPTTDFAIGSPAARKARESSGNPLTGQGYSDASTKTAKRYYGGSNANQKLW